MYVLVLSLLLKLALQGRYDKNFPTNLCHVWFSAIAYLAFTSKNIGKSRPFLIKQLARSILFYIQAKQSIQSGFSGLTYAIQYTAVNVQIMESLCSYRCMQGIPMACYKSYKALPTSFILLSSPQVSIWSLCRSFFIATSRFTTATRGMKKGVSLQAHRAFLNASAQ